MFFGTYSRKIGSDGCVRVPNELRQVLEKNRYEGFSSLLSLETTEEGNNFFYLELKPANGDANRIRDGKLWVPAVVNGIINPYAERELVFVGVDDHAELWSPRNWDLFEREYSPQFDLLADDLDSKSASRKAI